MPPAPEVPLPLLVPLFEMMGMRGQVGWGRYLPNLPAAQRATPFVHPKPMTTAY